ncbi:MAG: four helix bundle protein [Bacteroidia bacterium]|nr:four helix bundle protein [Bacteroidia bacterium]
MASIKRFEEIESWQLARELDKKIFSITKQTDFSKDFKLRDQILNSPGSIMDNIAEGFERGGNKEFNQFLSISKGSAGELKSQLYRALDRGYIDNSKFEELFNEANTVAKKIGGLMGYLSKSDFRGSKYYYQNTN